MDEDTRQILTEWKLSEYIEIFKENKIDIHTLNLLDQGMTKELIKPIGDRARFLQNLNLWKQISSNDECYGSITHLPQPQDSDDFVDQLRKEHKNLALRDLTNIQPSPNQVLTLGAVLSDQYKNLPLEAFTNAEPPSVAYRVPSPSPSTSSNSTANLLFSTPKKLQPLLDLLTKTAQGRNLLKLHQREGLLSNHSRRQICNIIVQNLLTDDPDVKVTHETLFSFAQEIKEIFPKENISTYFVPYVNNNKIKVKTCAKGKLYDCLHNRKREYREADKKNQTLKAEQDQVTNKNQYSNNQNDIPDDVQQDIIWLQNSTDPWQMVEKKWGNTVKYRLESLSTSDKTIVQYMTEFPALKSPAGYTLLTDDFKTLHPDKESLLHEKFCLHTDKILNYAKQERDESVKKITEELENQSASSLNIRTTEAKTIVAFMLLPLLLGNPLAKVKKGIWRPSKQECSEGFITHIVTAGELQTTISNRRDKFSRLNETLQPFIIIVGREYTAIDKYYVVVNNTHYVLHSIIDAVDVCFKIFQALNCRYPVECSSTWQFIQKGLYNIQTPYDKQFVSVNALLTDLGIEID